MKITDYLKIWMFLRKVKKEAMREVKTMSNDIKPGWKTTEFWVTIFAAGNTMLQSVQGSIPHPWGEIVVASMAAAYTISRALVKK